MLDHTRVALLFILIPSFFISCSTSSNTASPETAEPAAEVSSKYPGWYESSRSVLSDENAYYGYATAIASDSASSAEKAVEQAKAELKSSISNRLETIRNDAVVELGSASGLDNPRFIIALRKAENEVTSVASPEEIEVENLETNGYRAFSKVSVDKEALIKQLDKAFSANSRAWKAMKESEAFSQF